MTQNDKRYAGSASCRFQRIYGKPKAMINPIAKQLNIQAESIRD